MNEEVVRNTIQKMRAAGLSESMIAAALSELGLSSNQAHAFLAGKSSAKDNRLSEKDEEDSEDEDAEDLEEEDAHEELASRTSDKVVQRLEERNSLNSQEQSLKDTITHLALEQHGQKLDDAHRSVEELHAKFDSTNLDTISSRISTLAHSVEEVRQQVSETKALLSAVQSLMQKILEANQQMMFEWQKRK